MFNKSDQNSIVKISRMLVKKKHVSKIMCVLNLLEFDFELFDAIFL